MLLQPSYYAFRELSVEVGMRASTWQFALELSGDTLKVRLKEAVAFPSAPTEERSKDCPDNLREPREFTTTNGDVHANKLRRRGRNPLIELVHTCAA
jgi:hypothetical protein